MKTIEDVEEVLSLQIKEQVLPKEIANPEKILQRWCYFSNQVPRLLGGVLARVKIPDVHCLIAKTIYGECGHGKKTKIHGRLFINLASHFSHFNSITWSADSKLGRILEETLADISKMSQDEAIGFIVGLEAPAYDILDVLKKTLVAVGIPEDTVTQSEYMLIHEIVEKEHQESGHEAMELVINTGCDLNKIYRGGESAVKFWTRWWGA